MCAIIVFLSLNQAENYFWTNYNPIGGLVDVILLPLYPITWILLIWWWSRGIQDLKIYKLPLGIAFVCAYLGGFNNLSDYTYTLIATLILSSIYLVYKEKRNYAPIIVNLLIVLPMFFVFAIIILFSTANHGNPLGTSCISQTGYICESTLLHLNNFTATIGQATGTNWTNTYLLWIPQGQNPPNSTSNFCPATASNSVSGGISCYIAGNLSSEGIVLAKFIFNTSTTNGQEYSGKIWAEYQTNVGGEWHVVWVATVTGKAI